MTRAVDPGLTNLCPSLIPDGAIVLTTPSGRSHIATPTGARFFPQLAVPTATLALSNSPPASPNRGLAMPARKRIRTQDRAAASNTNADSTEPAPPPTHYPSDF